MTHDGQGSDRDGSGQPGDRTLMHGHVGRFNVAGEPGDVEQRMAIPVAMELVADASAGLCGVGGEFAGTGYHRPRDRRGNQLRQLSIAPSRLAATRLAKVSPR